MITDLEHMKAVAKRMTEKLKIQGVNATTNYLLNAGWSEEEVLWIIKKAKFYIEKENKL